MAKKKNIQTSENLEQRTSLEFLPKIFRTEANKKFLSSTLDQFISEGSVSKVNGYIGRKTSKSYKTTDTFIDSAIENRKPYRLEPAAVCRDTLDNIEYFGDYVDYINQLSILNSKINNHDTINKQQSYAWNPYVNWDMIVNYREYYWLPTGPQSITVKGQSKNIVSTYTVRLSDQGDNQAYIFTPDGLTPNPTLKLYRGQTYRFEIDCPGQPIAFSTTRSFFPSQSLIIATESGIETGGLYDVNNFDLISYDAGSWAYNTAVAKVDTGAFNLYDIWTEGVKSATVYVEKGTIEFTIPENSPNLLYYVSKNDINSSGLIKIFDINEATSIDVDKEIIGKKTYSLDNGTFLSNGMKIKFVGEVTPAEYSIGNWYVEGVGTSITLIPEEELLLPGPISDNNAIEFDNENFDSQGFDFNYAFPSKKDYIVINRSAPDRNQWSRYNKWFHRSVIEESARLTGVLLDLDQDARAKRPIIEFSPGLRLFNFGFKAKKYVDLIDTFTTDVFGSSPVAGVTYGVEGSLGYIVDGVSLVDGMRVLFVNDRDSLVNGRIYRVASVTHLGTKRITLMEEPDSHPQEGEVAISKQGKSAGTVYHYKDSKWILAQQKTKQNQSPLFDAFDDDGISFSDSEKYLGSTFNGTKIFSYKPGNYYDSELDFKITYRNIENIGDIVFDCNFHLDSFFYKQERDSLEKRIQYGYLKKYYNNEDELVNLWTPMSELTSQWVIRQYDISNILKNYFPIDVYDRSGELVDLEVKVYLNNVKQNILDFEIYRKDFTAYVKMLEDLKAGDVLIIKTRSSANKNSLGYYEFPSNLESNPLNENISDLTLGLIIDHVTTITDNVPDFEGRPIGRNNLRDLGEISSYGRKVVQHSASLLPIIYHLTEKNHNIFFSVRFAADEYVKFKRNFLKVAEDFGFDGDPKEHLDRILIEMFKDNDNSSSFYLSDMVPYRANQTVEHTVIDNSVTDYPLLFDFNLDILSDKAILVYKNNEQLLHGRDYIFVNDNFVRVFQVARNDSLLLINYDSTDGCFIPPTPTKLGLYPLYQPQRIYDDTYRTPVDVIQGHDGSITVAFNDFRDDLLIELETRIYNNIKVRYNNDLIDILPGYYRKTDFSLDNFNSTISQFFLRWNSSINKDYTSNDFFNESDPWTYNHSEFLGYDDKTPLPGFWRGIYKFVYDTDRPHTHPWEILGFTAQPPWWSDRYGPPPYTNNNLILWTDISEGKIRDSQNPRFDIRYARPTILNHIPVDAEGKLVNPIESNFVKQYYSDFVDSAFSLGDGAPIETAWRRSSQYPFALISSLLLMKPAEMFSRFFDTSRQIRIDDGQIIYRTPEGDKRFSSLWTIFPSTAYDTQRIFASGLINYVSEYTSSQSLEIFKKYKDRYARLTANLSIKTEGYVSKDKFKLILDSRTPLNEGNVFVPDENYHIHLIKSSPVSKIVYSGVVIERASGGFVVSGYNSDSAEFRFFKSLSSQSDVVVNVGGITSPYVDWSSGKIYPRGTIIRYDNAFYRSTVDHTSTLSFELKYFSKLNSIPIEGGRNIILRSRFDSKISTLYYGQTLFSVQDVVDFLLGYGRYLEFLGFKFDKFNDRLETIVDWKTAAREFAFWTTQNWDTGAAISLSPSSNNLEFESEYSVVDDIFNGALPPYTILKEDGNVLSPNFINSNRIKNKFNLSPRETSDGIYHAALVLVNKEHIIILDDKTIFNDTLYEKIAGYRQEKIKVVGYKTEGWSGDFSVPGFLYDRVNLFNWESWADYASGDSVKYKEFYYSAKTNISGSAEFNPTEWYKLEEKPVSKLIPNWEYRANQFSDFYDLDTDSFDLDQQKFAQHLIGYQNRKYLANIINDDVAQYKFYQGFIREKGTKNSLSKMFDALNYSEKDSIEFHELWALRVGQYGANDGFSEFEISIPENYLRINPQPIELVDVRDPNSADLVYRLLRSDIYIKPDGYDHKPFPVLENKSKFINSAGYVNPEDVNYFANSFENISTLNINDLKNGDYVWVEKNKISWEIRRFTLIETRIISMSLEEGGIKIIFDSPSSSIWKTGEFFSIKTSIRSLNFIHKITKTTPEFILLSNDREITQNDINDFFKIANYSVFSFVKWRFKSIDEIEQTNIKFKLGELVWTDNNDIDWKVWRYLPSYNRKDKEENERKFARNFVVSKNNLFLVTANYNRVTYYYRDSENFEWLTVGQINAFDDIPFKRRVGSLTFGDSLAVNSDGSKLLIGNPKAGGVSGDSSLSVNEGYVVFYSKLGPYYQVSQVYTSIDRAPDEFFGHKIEFLNDQEIIIAAKGSASVESAIYKFDLSREQPVSILKFSGLEIVDLVKSDFSIAISFSNGSVKILDHNLVDKQTIMSPGNRNIDFGYDLDLSDSNNFLAVGAPLYSKEKSEQGAVFLYKNENDFFKLVQTLTNLENIEAEHFGSQVKFFKDEQLLILGAGGLQTFETIFDNDQTIFDSNATKYIDPSEFVGTVKIYDKYESKFVYSTDVETLKIREDFSIDPLGPDYGSVVQIVNNHVYVNDPRDDNGFIYEYFSDRKTWYPYREAQPIVDIDKIKSVFLYNTETEEIVEELDYVDSARGKIPGIADQELSFKLPYDPAVYSLGMGDLVVDPQSAWTDEHVGKLWWDTDAAGFIEANQVDVLYKSGAWNSIFPNSKIKVYEWVRSLYTPDEWNSLSDDPAGFSLNVSGKTRYGNNVYSVKKKYDSISKTFTNIYYYWVEGATIVPDLESRRLSASDVARYIEDPRSMRLRYVSFLSNNQLSLVNCNDLSIGKKLNLNVRIWNIKDKDSNIHNQYQLISETDDITDINQYIEQKWIDSLIGFDVFGNPVPDTRLPRKLKYGILNKPRQGMFINRIEALKQFIERVNSVLSKTLLVDDFDYSRLYEKEEAPDISLGIYDEVLESNSQLRFVNVVGFKIPKLTAIVDKGAIVRVVINDPGRGYKIAPQISISGNGDGAKLKAVINSQGQITSVTVIDSGSRYDRTTVLYVRPYAVLILNDTSASNKWSIYQYTENNNWNRFRTQIFDTTVYWNSKDWYASGYNQFTKVDYIVDFTYQLAFENINIGDIVKINNQGTGGWVILEKVANSQSIDLSVDYDTVGRENGTIEFDLSLYNFKNSRVGFDGPIFDQDGFDEQPKEELRLIIDCIKNNLLIDQLKSEYKKAFFASLRYAFSEQRSIDWAFKTSFIVGKHNLGELSQPANFKTNNINDYKSYIEEVKPYSTKIKEFISAYEKIEQTRTKNTDFDLPVIYNKGELDYEVIRTSTDNGIINYSSNNIEKEPLLDWYENAGFGIKEITITDSGYGYLTPPKIDILGMAAVPARARAYLSNGKLYRIEVEEPGSGYVSTPIIEISGPISDEGYHGKAYAVLGDSLIRSNSMSVKFDRVAPKHTVTNLSVSQTFTGTGSRVEFDLKWPIDLKNNQITVKIFNEELLFTDFVAENILDETAEYTRYFGRITLETPPANFSQISIIYKKDVLLLDAADRVKYYYKPTEGMLPLDLGQLMAGVDYGGVELTGLDFGLGAGWDALPWGFTGYDNFDETYSDFLVKSDGSTRSWNLPYVPEAGEIINVYLNGKRIDDPFFDQRSPVVINLEATKENLRDIETSLIEKQSDRNTTNVTISSLISELQRISNLITQINAALSSDPTNTTLLDQQASLNNLYTTTNNSLAAANNIYISLGNEINELESDKIGVLDSISRLEQQLSQLPQLSNPDAVMNSFIGDGTSSGPIIIPAAVPMIGDTTPNSVIDTVVFRKTTSDGSFAPDLKIYDVSLIGGNFNYTNALGIRPEDITVDGDGFVTPYTSHAPEEVVPGQILDTLDITVYDKQLSNKTFVLFETYILTNSTIRKFKINQKLQNEKSVIVKIDDDVVVQGKDYEINYVDNSLNLIVSQFPLNKKLTIASFGINANNLLGFDSYRLLEDSDQIVTKIRNQLNYSVFFAINGIETAIEVIVDDDTNNLILKLAQPVLKDSLIEYMIFDGSIETASRMQKQTFVADDSTISYKLQNIPFYNYPLDNNVVVDYQGKILRPNKSYYFTTQDNFSPISIDSTEVPLNSVSINEIEVYQNGKLMIVGQEYDWNSSVNSVSFRANVVDQGDQIIIVIRDTGDYYIKKTGNDHFLFLNFPVIDDNLITITTFSDHDILNIERINSKFKSQKFLSGTPQYFKLNVMRTGLLKLPKKIVNIYSLWAIKNGKWLTPYQDYVLDGDEIRFDEKLITLDQEEIDIIIFDSSSNINSYIPIGFKQFKDILNRTVYTRLDDRSTTLLERPLKSSDTLIYLVDGSKMQEPSDANNIPGVILIDGERIEYMRKDRNVLSQLRRGTLGTGIKAEYSINTLVKDFNSAQIIPYKDENLTDVFVSNGSSNLISLNFIPKVNAGTLNPSWYRKTIPTAYGQTDEIEVFVGGKRLRKSPIKRWSDLLGPDSPSGDEDIEAEFAVDGVSAAVYLTVIPEPGVKILIQRKIGRLWNIPGISLRDSDTQPANFIKQAYAYDPETLLDKYLEIDTGLAPDNLILEDGSGPLTDEDGDPLKVE
jgi:hypothetical protein